MNPRGARWTPVLGLILFLALIAWMTQVVWSARGQLVSWSELKTAIAEDRVAEVVIDGDVVRAKLKSDKPEGAPAEDKPKQPVLTVPNDQYMQAVRVAGDESFIPL